MKNLQFTLPILIMIQTVLVGQNLTLIDIVQNPSPEVAVVSSLNERGGEVSFTRTYPNGCVGGYKVKVTFSKSLNILQPGETFQATLNCKDCSSSCKYKWKFFSVFAANTVRKIDQYPNYVYNENIEEIGSSNGSSGVNYWEPGMQSNVVTLKYNPKKDVPLTAFQINVAGKHEINFVFQANGTSENAWSEMEKPNLSCAWKSTYGDIHWADGYYGNSSKTLNGELVKRNGKWIFEGTWGRTGSNRWGKVSFIFTSPTTFSGYYTTGEGTKQTKWEGSGECLLIKR